MVKINSGIGIFVVFLLFFLIFQNTDQGVDSYAFVLGARNGVGFFHPHHLFYNSFQYSLYWASSAVGLEAMKVISMGSSLFGALTLAFIFLIIRSKTSSIMALMATVAMGCMHAFWSFSTSVEVNITSMMFISLALYYLSAKPPTAKNSMAVFVFLTLGTLFHQLTALAVIPILIYEAKRHKSYTLAVKYSLPSLPLGALLYLAIGMTQISGKNIGELFKWLTMYSHLGYWGTIDWDNFLISLWGIVKAVFGGDTLRQVLYGDGITVSGLIYIVAVFFSSVGLMIVFGYSVYRFLKKRSSFEWLLVTLAIIYAIFGFWWTPTDAGFWLYSILMTLLLIVMAIYRNSLTRNVLYVTVSLLVTINIFYEIIPASSAKKSVAWQGAAALNRLNLTSDDLLLTNVTRVRSALEYYYETIVPTTCLGFREFGSKEVVIENYHRLIERNPGRIILFENEISPELHRRFMYSRFSVEDFSEVYSRYIDRLMPLDSIEVFGKQVRIFQIEKNLAPGDETFSQ